MDLDKIDIEILFQLYTQGKRTPLNSMQIKTIVKHFEEEKPISYSTATRRMLSLIDKEYISEGYKLARARSFYISEKGTEFIDKLMDTEEIFVDEDDFEENENNNKMEEL